MGLILEARSPTPFFLTKVCFKPVLDLLSIVFECSEDRRGGEDCAVTGARPIY